MKIDKLIEELREAMSNGEMTRKDMIKLAKKAVKHFDEHGKERYEKVQQAVISEVQSLLLTVILFFVCPWVWLKGICIFFMVGHAHSIFRNIKVVHSFHKLERLREKLDL